MLCRKCKTEIPDSSRFCNFCGAEQAQPIRKPKNRGNGQGSVYKNGTTWTAAATVYDPERRTAKQGGFATRREGCAALPVLFERLRVVRAVSDTITFSALYERWVPFYQDRVSEGQMKSHAAAFKHFKPLHTIQFTQITTENLQDCISQCPRGKRVKEDMKCLASLLYRYAHDLQIAPVNYAKNLFCGREKDGTREAFTRNEVEIIRRVVGVEPYADYVYCMIYTGFRPGEMLALTKDRYDVAHQCFVGGYKTEAGTDRPVPISPKIKRIVAERVLSADPWIFPREGNKRMSDEYFRERCFKPLMETLGITGKVPYSCRHTFANLLKDVRGSDTDKAALMGHADASMTKTYQSADYEALSNIVNML